MSVKDLFGRLFEDTAGSIPRGRKFAKKGPQGAWKNLPPEMKKSYISDLAGYFADFEDPEKEVARNSIVWEEGGDIHIVFVEDEGQELESVWDDSADKWEHLEAEPVAGRKSPDEIDIDGNTQKPPAPPEPHREPKGYDLEKMIAEPDIAGWAQKRRDRKRGTGVTH